METIHSYPTTAIHAYTDGSAFKGTTFAGYGVLLKFPDGTFLKFSDSCGNNCSNYEAEAIAILTAIQIAHQNFDLGQKEKSDIVIFSDSMSVLEALRNTHQDNIAVRQTAQAIHDIIAAHNTHITLQWIPGHTDIQGNEIADTLAKSGATSTQKETPCTSRTMKQILKSNTKEEWLNRWARGNTGRTMYHDMPQPKRDDQINKLHRKEQCLIFQFRTGHAKVNHHLNRINPQHAPVCRHCPHPYETTTHLLLDCPRLKKPRITHLPPQPTRHNTLYGPLQQLRKTSNFLRLAMADKSEELHGVG